MALDSPPVCLLITIPQYGTYSVFEESRHNPCLIGFVVGSWFHLETATIGRISKLQASLSCTYARVGSKCGSFG